MLAKDDPSGSCKLLMVLSVQEPLNPRNALIVELELSKTLLDGFKHSRYEQEGSWRRKKNSLM